MKNGSFSVFLGLSVMLFHVNMERMTFRPWHHNMEEAENERDQAAFEFGCRKEELWER